MIIMLLDKKNALYVKCCIIANGVQDSQGDTLHREDIKKIFTSFNNQDNFEIYHDELPIQEVSLLENYISTADETIGTDVAPSGSWNAVVRVDNPEIQEGLLTGEFGGVSLNNRIAPRCKGNLTGTVRYKDVADAECVIPLLISFVKRGANGYGLHVMDYDAYIKKSEDIEFEDVENGGRKMDFKEFLNGLKSLIKEAEDTPKEDEAAIEKEDETTEKAEVVETTAEEVVDETTDEPTVEKADDETVEEEPEADSETEETESEAEPEIEKADDETETVEEEVEVVETEETNLEDRVAKLEEIVAELTKKEEDAVEDGVEETPDPEVEPVDEDTPKITKSEKVIVEDTGVSEPKNYYEMSGRDPRTGKKIRK